MPRSASLYPAQSPLLSDAALSATLAALVQLPSVNPAYGGAPGGEAAVIDWIASRLQEAGLKPDIRDILPGRPRLRVRLEGREPGPGLMFQTHVDTVSIAGMRVEPFGAEIRDGKLWGRGATDAKGQIAAMLHALLAWAAADAPPPRAIELALVPDEECGMLGSAALAREDFSGVGGIVIGEPTSLAPVVAHKGRLVWEIEFTGRAVHSSRPARGVNAIAAAAEFVLRAQTEYASALSLRSAPMLAAPTFNPAVIRGGVQANLVPPSCTLEVERRTLPGEDWHSVRAEVEALLGAVRAAMPGISTQQSEPSYASDAVLTDPKHPLVAMIAGAAHAHGGGGEPSGVDYCTDASRLQATGLPIVIIGPGSIDQAHTADEFIDLEALRNGAQLYADLMGRAGEWTTKQ